MFKKIKAWFLNRNRVINMTTVEAIKAGQGTLIDVREPYELETEGYVPNSINIPLGDVPNRVEEIKGMPQPVIVFCRSGNYCIFWYIFYYSLCFSWLNDGVCIINY